MSVKQQLELELDRVAALGGGDIRVGVGNDRIEGHVTTVDQVGCAFESFALRTDRFAQSSIDDLKQVADGLASQLSYLLESISPVEIDRDACIVQMRSNPPQKDDDGTKYYELVVQRDGIFLSRYQKVSGQPREVVPASVTREVLGRLADDLCQAAAN